MRGNPWYQGFQDLCIHRSPEGGGEEAKIYAAYVEAEPGADLVADQAMDYERQIAELQEAIASLEFRNAELERDLQAPRAAPAPAPALTSTELLAQIDAAVADEERLLQDLHDIRQRLETRRRDAEALRRALDLLGLGQVAA